MQANVADLLQTDAHLGKLPTLGFLEKASPKWVARTVPWSSNGMSEVTADGDTRDLVSLAQAKASLINKVKIWVTEELNTYITSSFTIKQGFPPLLQVPPKHTLIKLYSKSCGNSQLIFLKGVLFEILQSLLAIKISSVCLVCKVL